MYWLWEVFYTIYIIFIAKPIDLAKLYGKNSYVIITGGSKGIGLGMAKEFAKQNFNLVLIARNKEDLQIAAKEIKEINDVEILTRSFDFNLLSKPNVEHDMWELLNLPKDLDYSILLNNVGTVGMNFYKNLTEKEIKKIITVNCTSQAVMSHMMTKKFKERGKLSCIIGTSSISNVYPFVYKEIYGATKSFNKYFSATLLDNPKIDSYVLSPGYVDTPLTKKIPGLLKISIEECAKNAIKFIGRGKFEFSGHWKHEVLSMVLRSLPGFILRKKKKVKLEDYQ
jgi:short-subunit dehydrogenase